MGIDRTYTDALALRDALAKGETSVADTAEGYLTRITAVEPDIGAFAWYDADHIRRQAEAMDNMRQAGRPIGPLHGVPVALKDVIDTARIPTENGTPLDAGRVPRIDADLVKRLKSAGALIMGKTVSTELAFMQPSTTRNPHDPNRTPGGSSSGSAAAVSAGMVPLAVGTQTGGSVIRPASFCGTTGFKPTFGAISTQGALVQSPSLDTMGVFARTPREAALICDVLFAPEQNGVPVPPPGLLRTVMAGAPLPPIFACLQMPGSERADPQTLAAIAELGAALGEQAFDITLPDLFAKAEAERRRINLAEMARCYHAYATRGGLSEAITEAIAEGNTILARDYIAALDWPKLLNAMLDEVFQRCDAILCPAALGPAPGRETTGDPRFNGIWTLCGTPAVTIPILEVDGMPLGVQLIGPRGGDARLLRTAQWLYDWIDTAGETA
ncbi:amidase (plasmid) [Pseudorhodobacter turbinis]|uniref:Amidase n=1 Tax=Pseudorhodobacter turbinis TaxID=2500533 RepID=A0A4V1E169_9RHOB|nr:amidase [Pseudorhodobacter turbinis]QCO57094.1 amidase [Pseudorhodobacter turbinis]